MSDPELDDHYSVSLTLDPDNRLWELLGHGSAASLLCVLLDTSPTGLIATLKTEAKFDEVVASFDQDA